MTWSERLAHMAKFQTGDYFTHHVPRFVADRLEAHNQGGAGSAGQVGEMAAELLFTRGPAFVRNAFAPMRHVLPQAVASYLKECDVTIRENRPLSTAILTLSDATNAFEIIGFDVPPSVLESFRRYLVAIDVPRESPALSWIRGFTALALNERRVWTMIAGYIPGQAIPFRPGETFEFNVQGLLAHLGAARLVGASFEDVRPAFWHFMMCADMLFDVNQIDYELVLWIARVVFHHIAGEPLGSVADLLYTTIQTCVTHGL
ncbi:MAG TPA: hypothetical protein VNO30_23385 [Kofleriaceae bacterium]|nr:hypothetical protein [Kofleriaceae bacterium]